MNEMNTQEDVSVETSTQTGQLKPHRGTMILVFGILGLVCCIIFGIVAWIMGNKDLAEMDAGLMDPEGRGLTQAGKVCGIISVVIQIIGIIIYILMMIIGIGAGIAQS